MQLKGIPGTNRFKLHYLYYFLAGFDLITVVISLGLSFQILSIYTASVDNHHDWSTRQLMTSELSELAAEVNAPGNDVFTSGDPDQEHQRLDQVWDRYMSVANKVQTDLKTLPSDQSHELLASLEAANAAMRQTRKEAVQVFEHVREEQTESAGQAMSRMDQHFASGLSSLMRLSRLMSDLQMQKLSEEAKRAASLGNYELGIMGLVLCMVSLAVYYGHTLAAKAAQEQVRRDSMQTALVEASRKAGMADVATGVLHNVGNVLNSVNISANTLQDRLDGSRASHIHNVTELLEENSSDLGGFFESERGQKLIPFMSALSESVQEEHLELRDELASLASSVDHMKDIVQMQQSLARLGGVDEPFEVVGAFEDALKINDAGLTRHGVTVERDYTVRPVVVGDRHKVLQILVNLISNAKYAVSDSPNQDKNIVLRIRTTDDHVIAEVEDNGVGIEPENINRIFAHGFTTKGNDGHGFGLHSSSLAATEMKGKLTVDSKGSQQGACFTLSLPKGGTSCQTQTTPEASVAS